MSKGLEALHRLYLTNNTKLPYCKNGECLKDYELVEKELKALEIIKEKEVDIKAMNDLQDLEDYNYYCSPELTKEEYDLVKEVLYGKEKISGD